MKETQNRALSRGIPLVLCCALLLLCLIFAGLRLRLPAPSAAARAAAGNGPGFLAAERFDDIKSQALQGLSYIRKIYRLAGDLLVAPEPNPAAFGETTDSAQVAQVVADAAELLDGQQTLWNENIQLRKHTTMHYYRDETILALTWQEYVNDKHTVTFAEVKIADPSQFRRKLAGDTYGSTIQKFPAELAGECNAVLATSGDFYRYQKQGIHVYQGELLRADGGDKLDTCFIDGKGDLLFVHAGELADEAAIRRYIAEHNVSFSLCFGPIVIENGVNVAPTRSQDYPLGECGELFSRAFITQLGELHYMIAVVYTESWMQQAVQILLDKGITHAYSIDGGQTGSIVIGGEQVNPLQYGSARTQSDVLYFPTALPPAEAPDPGESAG